MAHLQVPFSLYMCASMGIVTPETWIDALTRVDGRDALVPGIRSAANSWLLTTPTHFMVIVPLDARHEAYLSLLINARWFRPRQRLADGVGVRDDSDTWADDPELDGVQAERRAAVASKATIERRMG